MRDLPVQRGFKLWGFSPDASQFHWRKKWFTIKVVQLIARLKDQSLYFEVLCQSSCMVCGQVYYMPWRCIILPQNQLNRSLGYKNITKAVLLNPSWWWEKFFWRGYRTGLGSWRRSCGSLLWMRNPAETQERINFFLCSILLSFLSQKPILISWMSPETSSIDWGF